MMHGRFAASCARMISGALTLLCAGCAWVRRDTVTAPQAPSAYVSEFHARATARVEAGAAPQAPDEAPAPARERSPGMPPATQNGPWWTAFADPALDAAIREALAHNYTIADLRTLIYENQLDPSVPRGWLWPLQIEIPALVQRSTIATPHAANQPDTYSEANVGLAASYRVDVWGQLDLQRRTIDDLVEQQRQNTEAYAQTLAEQVAQVWF
jgi:multidrug efflux system outer membrane protein